MPRSLPLVFLRNAALLAAGGAALFASTGVVRGLTQRAHSTPAGARPAQECPGMCRRSFINKDGLRIHFSVRAPAGVDPDAAAGGAAAADGASTHAVGLVVVVHGFGEHSGRYEHVSGALTRAGFLVYLIDHQGHGQSEGDRAHVVHFGDYAEDVLVLARLAQARHPQFARDRTFLLGHSMGGAISIEAMQLAASGKQVAGAAPPQLAGAVLSAPAITVDPALATPVKVAAARVLASLVPKMQLEKLEAGMVSHDPAVVADYENDPLVYRGGMRVGFANEMLKMNADIERTTPDVHFPFLLLHGSGDCIIPVAGSRRFFERASSEDKTYREFEGWFHEVFNEPEGRDEQGVNAATTTAVDWLLQRATFPARTTTATAATAAAAQGPGAATAACACEAVPVGEVGMAKAADGAPQR